MTYEKFYDDYERGTWFISPMDDEGFVQSEVIVDGLTGPQADAVLDALKEAYERGFRESPGHRHVYKYDRDPDGEYASFECAIASELDPRECIRCGARRQSEGE